MDTRTGRIFTPEEMKVITEHLEKQGETSRAELENVFRKIQRQDWPKKKSDLVAMKIPPTTAQLKRKKVGRNEPCPCGSGTKFKRCCLQSASSTPTTTPSNPG